MGEGTDGAPQGATEHGEDILHFFLSFKPDPGKAGGILPCPGLEGQLFSEKPSGRSRRGFPGTGVSWGGRETERLPLCPSSLLGPWPHIASPNLHPGPLGYSPTGCGEVFWGQHEAAHTAGGQAAGWGQAGGLCVGLCLPTGWHGLYPCRMLGSAGPRGGERLPGGICGGTL